MAVALAGVAGQGGGVVVAGVILGCGGVIGWTVGLVLMEQARRAAELQQQRPEQK